MATTPATRAALTADEVRRRYAAAALAATRAASSPGTDERPGCGCADSCCTGDEGAIPTARPAVFGTSLYQAAERESLPAAAALASLGCGNPTAVADLQPGETVLDLGSGGGIDLILSARRVGPEGTVYGLDMTDEMLALARRNLAEAGTSNVHLLKGLIEDVPLPAGSVDVVISNCVVNLSTDKAAVLAEIARVLRPGGRLGLSDVVAEDRLTAQERADRGSYTGCIAGALSRAEWLAGLAGAGLVNAEVELTHQVADGMHGAVVRALKPLA